MNAAQWDSFIKNRNKSISAIKRDIAAGNLTPAQRLTISQELVTIYDEMSEASVSFGLPPLPEVPKIARMRAYVKEHSR